jgi:hypothetical protein
VYVFQAGKLCLFRKVAEKIRFFRFFLAGGRQAAKYKEGRNAVVAVAALSDEQYGVV